jgi:hypothetical protein
MEVSIPHVVTRMEYGGVRQDTMEMPWVVCHPGDVYSQEWLAKANNTCLLKVIKPLCKRETFMRAHLMRDECWSVVLFFLPSVCAQADRRTHETLHQWLRIANALLRIQSASVLSCFPVFKNAVGALAFAGD